MFLLAFMLVFPVYSFGKADAVQAAALKAPKLSKVVRVNKSVKITWKKSKGASGYYVMRKTENSSWKKIKTVKGGSKTSYTDKKGKSGTTYYYTVSLQRKESKFPEQKGLKIVYEVPTTTKPDTTGGMPRQQVPLLQNTASEYTIETDMVLSGSGSGYYEAGCLHGDLCSKLWYPV